MSASTAARCAWATTPESIAYHDREWGVPVHDDRVFFEFLVLEGAQAGLSWETVLRKRDRYRQLFYRFDPKRVAKMSPHDVERLLADPGIIRNRAKVQAAIANARVFCDIAGEFGSFDRFVWRFVDGRPIVKRRRHASQLPASSPQAQALSAELKRRGMRFVGPTICYAFMQATGLVDDHLAGCPAAVGHVSP
jgi:DNA-3-methyladenine glycosylase I